MSAPKYIELLKDKLSDKDRAKHGPMLDKILEVGKIGEACRLLGIKPINGHLALHSLRKRYNLQVQKDKDSGFGLSPRQARRIIANLAKSDRAPSVSLKAATTILEKQNEMTNSVTSGNLSGAIVINLVASESEFDALRLGGRYSQQTDNKQDSESKTS